MARGKHGAIAERRREIEGYQSEIETYKRNVKRLTEENRELKQKLKAEQQGRRQDVRALKAQLAEGLSPEINALHRKLDEQSSRASAAEARMKERQRQSEVMLLNCVRLIEHFGIKHTVAWGIMMRLVGIEHVKRIAATKGGQDAIMRQAGKLSEEAREKILDARTGGITEAERDALDAAGRIGSGSLEEWMQR